MFSDPLGRARPLRADLRGGGLANRTLGSRSPSPQPGAPSRQQGSLLKVSARRRTGAVPEAGAPALAGLRVFTWDVFHSCHIGNTIAR